MRHFIASMLIGLAFLGTSFVSTLLMTSSGTHSMDRGLDSVCVAHCIAQIQQTDATGMMVTFVVTFVLAGWFWVAAKQTPTAQTLFAFARGEPPDPHLLLTIIQRD